MKEKDNELRGELTLEKIDKTQEINEKLEYIGLDLKAIPETLKLVEDMEAKWDQMQEIVQKVSAEV